MPDFPNGISVPNADDLNLSVNGLRSTEEKGEKSFWTEIRIWSTICGVRHAIRVWLLLVLYLYVNTVISVIFLGWNGSTAKI